LLPAFLLVAEPILAGLFFVHAILESAEHGLNMSWLVVKETNNHLLSTDLTKNIQNLGESMV